MLYVVTEWEGVTWLRTPEKDQDGTELARSLLNITWNDLIGTRRITYVCCLLPKYPIYDENEA